MQELIQIQHDLKVGKGRNNPSGGYSYRSCEDILKALREPLYKVNCFVTLTDDMVMVGERIYVKATATITNENGASVSTTASARESDVNARMLDGQNTGAASSYARKYALCGLFAIDDEVDLDSPAEEEPKKETVKPTRKRVTKQPKML